MMSKSLLEKLAMGLSAVVLVAAMWFWFEQIQHVLELLSLAYGDE